MSTTRVATASARGNSLRAIQALGVLAALGFMAFCASLVVQSRQGSEDQVRAANVSLALALAQDVSKNFEIYGLALQGVLEGLREPELATATPAVRKLALFDRAAQARYINLMSVIDADGHIVEQSNDGPLPTVSFADRDYFKVHQRSADEGLYVSKPLRSRLSGGEWIIVLSRRVSRSDGSFGGIVAAALSLSYFESLFANLSLSSADSFTAVSADGVILMRHPFRMPEIGSDISFSPVFKLYPRQISGFYDWRAKVDAVPRLYTFAAVPNLPLLIIVGAEKDRLFGDWLRKTALMIAMMALLCVAMGALWVMLARELARRRKAERQLTDLAAHLETLATTDSLTELSNRRFFDDVAESEWRRAVRAQTAISLLIVDADHFKRFNDRFGHARGDVALKAIAGCIARRLRRPADLAARYGGEEFAILLPDTDIAGAEALAEDIRRDVMAISRDPLEDLSGLTVSIGVATARPAASGAFVNLFLEADAALYAAKAGGRNGVQRTPPAEAPASFLRSA